MKISIQAGKTSESINVFISDSSSTTGAGLTGLVYNSGSLVAYYSFTGANATGTAITLATLAAITSAWATGGFKEIDATNMPGWYRLDLPNAVLATSKGRVVSLLLKGATNMAPCPVEIELTGWDNQDTVRGGLTAFPNVASGSAGALLVAGTGTAALSVSSGVAQADVAKIIGTAPTEGASGRLAGGITTFFNVASPTGTVNSLPGVVPGSTGGLILIGTGTRDINPNAGGVVITSTGMDDVAAHVWDLAYSGHNTAGTFGYQVQNIATGTPPTAAAIASQVRTELTTELGRIDVATSTRLATAGYTAPPSAATNAAAVWDLSRSGHSTSGTFGEGVIVQTNNDKTGYGLSDGAITTAKFATGAIDATVIATDAFGALELADDAAAEIVTKLFDVADGVETGVTFRNAMRYIAAICAGKVSGAGTGTETFKGIGTNTTRVVVTADISGNRSAVTLS